MTDIVKAEIICDSVSSVSGARLTTFILEYPRITHSELLTHRMLSRNSASSRAIPFNKMKEQLTGRPIRFGEANPGMQDKGEDFETMVIGWPQEYEGNIGSPALKPVEAWNEAKEHALYFAQEMYNAKLHKQCYNRLTEPFQKIRVIASATDWQNFFWLRNDKAADPTLEALAKKMEEAYNSNVACLLHPGEWHLPFVKYDPSGYGYYIQDNEGNLITLTPEEAIKVSAARCAAVSYRNEDYGLEKCLQLYDRLVGDERKHASALEHQAKVMESSKYAAGVIFDRKDYQLSPDINIAAAPLTWQKGITHSDRKGVLWSGNFRGFVQHRQLIEGQNKESY